MELVTSAANLLTTAVQAVGGWINHIFVETKAIPIYLGCLIAFFCVRFFISNVMKTRVPGGFWGQSDLAGSSDFKWTEEDRQQHLKYRKYGGWE